MSLLVLSTVIFITTIPLPIKSQCLVSTPTIVSSSSSDDVCAVLTQETLSYTCNNNGNVIVWISSVFSGDINVIAGSTTGTLAMPATGVTLTENDNDNATCLNSTLTFTGALADLEQLNGVVLTCSSAVNVTIVIPVLAGPPTSVNEPSTTCGSNGNQVTLQWTPPTNTGGQGVMITHYNITGLPQSASCSTGPCDMVDGTATTITGLQCDDDIMVSVRAVNCRGVGSASQVMINLRPPGKPSFVPTSITNGNLTLHWTPPPPSDCDSSLSYTLNISDADSTPILMNTTTDTNARVTVDSSDNYTVSISASNGCGAGPAISTVISNARVVTPSSTVPVHGLHTTSSIPATSTLPANVITITRSCLVDSSVSVQWMPPSCCDSLCTKIQNYSLVVSNSTGVLVTMTIEGQTRSVSVSVTSSDYYNISLTANSVCSGNLTTSVTTDIASTACVDSITGYQVGLSVGIPVTFLLTAIISSLLTLLITYLCLTMRGRSHSKFTPQQQQGEPVYDPVSAVSGTRPTAAVEMKSNVAYGTTAAATAASGNITYETVLPPQ